MSEPSVSECVEAIYASLRDDNREIEERIADLKGAMVREGVTSAFELEVGTNDVAAWYATRHGGQIVNYGVSVGHIPLRMKVLGDPGKGLLPVGIGGSAGERGILLYLSFEHPFGQGL